MKQKKGMELVTERTVDGFRRELLRREYSHGTAESYVRSIRAFARWSGGAMDRGLVLTWKARLTAQYAPATVNAMLAGLNRFFDFSGRPECRVKVLRLQAAASGRRNGNWTGKNTARWSAPPERWGGNGWHW